MKPAARIFILTATAIVWLTSCSDPRPAAIPRPRAYVRPAPADTTSVHWTDGKSSWIHSAEAVATSPRESWVTVTYPRRHISLYITYTHATGNELAAARENRMERLLLNSGSGSATEQEFVNPAGWQVYLLKSQNTTTPIQFLATDGSTTLVSGSMQVNRPDADDYEAIRPDVDLVSRDILTSLGQLK